MRDMMPGRVGSVSGTLGGLYTEGIYPNVPLVTEGGTTVDRGDLVVLLWAIKRRVQT